MLIVSFANYKSWALSHDSSDSSAEMRVRAQAS